MEKFMLIGRHSGTEIDGIEIVESRNVQFPATADGCFDTVCQLICEAHNMGAGILFQAMPGQLAVALSRMNFRGAEAHGLKVGVIVSKPAPREADKELTLNFSDGNMFSAAEKAEQLAKFIDPNCRVTVNGGEVTAKVDPKMKFTFSHIDWF